MKHLITTTLLLTFSFLVAKAANAKSILCQSDSANKVFVIEDHKNSIVFIDPDFETKSIRKLASVETQKRNINKGFSKHFYDKGQKVEVHIENQSQFNENEDFIAFQNKEGHRMSYSINCKNI